MKWIFYCFRRDDLFYTILVLLLWCKNSKKKTLICITELKSVYFYRFYRVYCEVEPKRLALNAANAELAAAVDKLKGIQNKIKSLEEVLDKLTADFERATAEKIRCQEQADATNRTIK